MTKHPLYNHIQQQQGRVAVLRELLRCLTALEGYRECEDLRLAMMEQAELIASEVDTALDSVNLPKEAA